MWDTIKELFKLPGNKIIIILAAILTVTSFVDIAYGQKGWLFSIRYLPNWYLLATSAILFAISVASHRLSRDVSSTASKMNNHVKTNTDMDWLSKFAAIDVDPLVMYGFGEKPSPSVLCEVCCVHVMWADPRGNSVQVKYDDDKCHIEFNNIYPGAYPSDVTIRPAGHQALSNSNPDGSISHCILSIHIQNNSQDAADKISVGFRVVDRLGTHWSYAKGPDYHILTELAPGEMKAATCNLNKNHFWQLFSPDGNCKYHSNTPDFSIISAIVFEVGGPNATRRPGTGKGNLLIKGIYLQDE